MTNPFRGTLLTSK